jgi:nitroreductase
VETWRAIDSLRVVREFDERPLSEDRVTRILDAGRRAGSAKNLQRWVFIVVQDRARLAALSKSGPWAGHVEGAALAIALVTPDPRAADQPLSIMWDLGKAAQNMMLAAWDLGIGSCPATVYEHLDATRVLELPDDQHCEYVLSFGYPADPTVSQAPNRPGGRASLSEVVRRETWLNDAPEP